MRNALLGWIKMMNKKPLIGLEPRHFWLRKRTQDCCQALLRLADHDYEWDEFRRNAKNLATELLYAVDEWEKYYPGNKDE